MSRIPLTESSQNYYRIEKAIQYLAGNFKQQPDLEIIASQLNLSKYHFQRIFKDWAGVTPSQFLRYLTVEYAKEKLKQSQSLLVTALDSGLSSPGRLHDLFVTFEAMTPGEFKLAGQGLEIYYGHHPTPFGRCLIAVTERGICSLRFLPMEDDGAILADLMGEWPRATFHESKGKTAEVIERIFAPVEHQDLQKLKLLLKGTNFQVRVWQGLLEIPAGMLMSYVDLAKSLGMPSSTRAVAGSVARNPIAYLIPCHRVIKKVGEIHRYRWGEARKKAMIGWEAAKGIY